MRRASLLSLFCMLAMAGQAFAQNLTLEKIMADPDWIGPAAKDAYWSADGRSVYYSKKRPGSPIEDLHRLPIAGGNDRVVDAAAMTAADGPAVFDQGRKRAAFVRSGDIFVRDLGTGRLTQITRSPQKEEAPQFSPDGKLLSFRIANDWFVHDFASGVTSPAAIVLGEKDPEAADAPDDLHDMQLRTFSTLRRQRDDKQALRQQAELMRKGDATRAAAPFYLGEDANILDALLSPDARWLILVTTSKAAAKGFEGKLTRYVTESGYEEFEPERLRVGRNPRPAHSLTLLNLVDHTAHPLSYDVLPGITDDPLAKIREENGIHDAPPHAARSVLVVGDDPDEYQVGGMLWSADAGALAVQIVAADSKDRWLASVDLAKYSLVPLHRLTDPAWINWTLNDFGWLGDNRTLWFQSEQSGYAQLYAKALNGPVRELTQGRFEVAGPQLSGDGRWFYFLSNAEAPYAWDVYRVPSRGGTPERISRMQGVEKFALDPSGRHLLLTHSSAYIPPQLALLAADGSGAPRELTDTRTAGYKSISWIDPEVVKIPSTHIEATIYAKLYRAAGAAGHAPAVIFIHGAGYLQNVHKRYPYYFREQMFNNLLVQHGYVVLDLDYRASAGYGRDWRTAIYRQMGHPELEDVLDAKRWLVEHAAADGRHVGLYGGSYGGFMTLMALFRAPGEFAAGAALRPVTDWRQYENDYTGAILNDPKIDPLAYLRSSPIEFADGLRDSLLICHGVMDDNVLFEDSMRLYQRLIELHKDNFSLSPYPLDRHAFANADSWLDEYKRIFQLFEAHLK